MADRKRIPRKVGRRTLQRKYWKSDVTITLSHKGKAIFSTDFWPTLFGSTDFKLVGIRGRWANVPTIILYFVPKVAVTFDEAEISLVRNGKKWFEHKSGRIPEIAMLPEDTFEISVQLEKLWNGK